MIRAEDLRIGNFLQGKTICKVNAIYPDGSIGICDNTSRFVIQGENPCLSPIEITEQWLLDFGFEDNPKNKQYEISFAKHTGHCWFDVIKHENNYFYILKDIERTVGTVFFDIKYVHELQNLYYTLIKTELKYKPSKTLS